MKMSTGIQKSSLYSKNGIATTFGSKSEILVQNPLNFPQKSLPSKIWFYEYLHLKNIFFFLPISVKMTSNPANTEPVNFLVGLRQEEYILEHHQILIAPTHNGSQP